MDMTDSNSNVHEKFMGLAVDLSAKAGLVDKVGACFGAIVVKDGVVIGEGFNQVFKESDPTWHGEMHAIREACKKLGSPSLAGCTMYSSAQPCPMCCAAIYWSKIKEVYYGATVSDVESFGIREVDKDDDIFHGMEMFKPPAERTGVPFRQIMREEACAVFKKFLQLPDEEKPRY
ncbi:hypothetical protein CEUSTIGMA_g2416.t1 [Chlamydomonas eustigma]|uniref:CMP/dCMP-type deaminase domain-containing protein n=1 Tax=Chlamydomonas eustigma TaxID=1157962 RepID=A0A250WWR9_9CHLO|nr:hypothetical protein CEUSTIGMA_g2416.t1 [Chlamydomonas eustigma]|eukprot:GAX74970.1 hypothetical protein CEUSTIGMA_g2416.t1 [Chlamydomonas eustigma]